MVSIRQSLTELEQRLQLQRITLDCYKAAVECAAHYAVDLDPTLTPPHREHMDALASEIGQARGETVLVECQSRLRNLMRDYRDKAAEYLGALHEDLAAKAASLQQIFDAMAMGDGEHELRMNGCIRRLRETAAGQAAAAVRTELAEVAGALDEALRESKRQHQLTVAQFLVEIQMLHKRIATLQSAASVDAITQLATRSELESAIAVALSAGAPICVMQLRLRNLAIIHRQYGEAIRDATVRAFAKRLRTCLTPTDLAGRWSSEEFAVVRPLTKREAMDMLRSIIEHVNGVYVCMEDGQPIRPALQVDVTLHEAGLGEKADRLIHRLDAFKVDRA
jgi:diguanylate cyclase (GGDEF)-like protein